MNSNEKKQYDFSEANKSYFTEMIRVCRRDPEAASALLGIPLRDAQSIAEMDVEELLQAVQGYKEPLIIPATRLNPRSMTIPKALMTLINQYKRDQFQEMAIAYSIQVEER